MVSAGETRIYREICAFCGREEGFPGFPVGAAVSPAVIRCVGLAREMVKEEGATTRTDREANWLRKSAEEADLDLDVDVDVEMEMEMEDSENSKRLTKAGKKRIGVREREEKVKCRR